MNDSESSDENKGFSNKTLNDLLMAENYMGAWIYLKGSALSRVEEGIQVGVITQAILGSLSLARQKDDRERQFYLRALMSWVLRDFPGLASLYREQVRQSPSFVPDGLGVLWQDFTDILSGRKGLDEEFRQKMDEAINGARENGHRPDTLERVVQDVQCELKKGVENLQDFLGNIFKEPGSESQKTQNSADSSAKTTDETPKKTVKVKIQDADDPLPSDLQKANPPVEPKQK